MSDYHAYLQALQPFSGEIEILFDEPMANHTTFHIGGPADIFLRPRTQPALCSAVMQARSRGLACVVAGNGSNLLVCDEGVRGVVVQTGLLRGVERDGVTLSAQMGAPLSRLAAAALQAGLTGLEFAAGIPGTIGGAVLMNAGAYGGEISQVVTEVDYLDEAGEVRTLARAGCGFAYRTSIFAAHPDWTVLRAALTLQPDDPAAVSVRMEDFSQRRRDRQPLDVPSAGSTFKRPAGAFAGELIEQAGCKGLAVGGAQVSEKHAGFVINRGGATCADVRALIDEVRARVLTHAGVTLACEIKML